MKKQIKSLENSIKSKFNRNKYKIEFNTKADFCVSLLIYSEYENSYIETKIEHCLRIHLINSYYQTIINDIYVDSEQLTKSKEIINENLTLDLINEYENYFKLDEFDVNILFELKMEYFDIKDFERQIKNIYKWSNDVVMKVKNFEINTDLFKRKMPTTWVMNNWINSPIIESQFNNIIKDFKKQLSKEELNYVNK